MEGQGGRRTACDPAAAVTHPAGSVATDARDSTGVSSHRMGHRSAAGGANDGGTRGAPQSEFAMYIYVCMFVCVRSTYMLRSTSKIWSMRLHCERHRSIGRRTLPR